MSLLVPTPRAVKRIANTYRLLRASLDAKEMNRFLPPPEGQGEFAAVGLLLGVIVGFPNQANALFRSLFETDEPSWWDFVKSFQPYGGWSGNRNRGRVEKRERRAAG